MDADMLAAIEDVRQKERESKRAKKHEYYIARRAEFRAKNIEYIKAHNAERNAYTKAYYRENSEVIKAKHRERYKANPEKARAWMSEFRKANPEKIAIRQRKSHLKRVYGMTIEEWDRLFTKQGNKCAMCTSTNAGGRGWHVDHDHSTGTVRGIICRNCNLVLGHAKDNTDTLYAAIKYLESFRKALEIAKL